MYITHLTRTAVLGSTAERPLPPRRGGEAVGGGPPI